MLIEFDDCYGHDNFVTLQDDELKVICGNKTVLNIIATPDQWGTFFSFNCLPFSVASEAGTRSFLDALIKGLQEFRERWDMS